MQLRIVLINLNEAQKRWHSHDNKPDIYILFVDLIRPWISDCCAKLCNIHTYMQHTYGLHVSVGVRFLHILNGCKQIEFNSGRSNSLSVGEVILEALKSLSLQKVSCWLEMFF